MFLAFVVILLDSDQEDKDVSISEDEENEARNHSNTDKSNSQRSESFSERPNKSITESTSEKEKDTDSANEDIEGEEFVNNHSSSYDDEDEKDKEDNEKKNINQEITKALNQKANIYENNNNAPIKDRIQVFKDISYELDNLEIYLKKKFRHFEGQTSEYISDKFTRK